MLNFKDMTDDDLRSISAPALFIGADKDVVTAEHLVKMAKLVPGGRLAILPGNHSTIIGEIGVTAEEAKLSAITVAIAAAFLHE
jgi:pimeloyl-ACP methyl ester carboxylesterase